jgi:hypothetical protein
MKIWRCLYPSISEQHLSQFENNKYSIKREFLMKNIDDIAEGLFGKIRSRFPRISMGDENAKATSLPREARFINFDFEFEGSDLGNVTISLNDNNSLKVYYGSNVTKNLVNPHAKEKWYGFLKELRSFAKMNMLSFDPRDIGKGNMQVNDIKNLATTKQAYTMRESVEPMTGNAKKSWQRMGNVKIVVNHSDKIDENVKGARTRKIHSIYLETAEGERFKMPFNKLPPARAMARHLNNEGTVYDDFGRHIVEMVSEMSDLAHFVRSAKNTVFEDGETKNIVEAATDHYYDMKAKLHKMSGQKGYQKAKEDINGSQDGGNAMDGARSPNDSSSAIGAVKPDYERFAESLKDKFTRKSFDTRLEAALPHIARAYANKKNRDVAMEATMKSFIRTPNITKDPMKMEKFKEMKDVMKMEDKSSLATKIYEFIETNEDSPEVKNLARSAKRWSSDLEESESRKILALEFAKAYMESLKVNKNQQKAVQEFAESIERLSEGTWATPDTEVKIKDLQGLLDKPLEFGVDGNNASSALYNILGNDKLFDELYSGSKHSGPEADARPMIEWWIRHNMPELVSQLDFTRMKKQDKKNDSVSESTITQKWMSGKLPNGEACLVLNYNGHDLRIGWDEQLREYSGFIDGKAVGSTTKKTDIATHLKQLAKKNETMEDIKRLAGL